MQRRERRSWRPLALALGGGSARGYAHVGVIKVLESAGLRPDLITGTSIGAVFGALWATGYAAADLEQLVLELDARRIIWMVHPHPSKTAMFDLRGFMEFIEELVPADFSGLPIPLACVATDLRTGERVVLAEGDLHAAIRASVSIPVVFPPATHDGRLLVDGGLVEPVPVQTAHALGARGVVAVMLNVITEHEQKAAKSGQRRHGHQEDLFEGGDLLDPGRRLQIAANSMDILERRLAQIAVADADVVIAPRIEKYSQFAFLDAGPLISLGEEAARAALPAVRLLAG